MKNWQPIETAPKDGTKIDLWLRIYASPRSFGMGDSFRVIDCWYNERERAWLHYHEGKIEPLFTDYVTHWLAIPPGPA